MIIFCASDVGPTNYLVYTIKELDMPVIVFGSTLSIPIFQRAGIQAILFDPKLIDSTVRCAVLGTSLMNTAEKEIIRLSKDYFFPTISIVDNWTNYIARFRYRDILFYPDYIFVNDAIAKNQAIEEGVPEASIHIAGNPVLEDQQNVKRHCLQACASGKILFISEQLHKNMPTDGPRYLGFNQFDVLDDIIALSQKTQIIYLKLHPSEDVSEYESYLKNDNVVLVSSEQMYKNLSQYSVIIGMESFLLIEFAAAGISAYSYRPNSIRDFIGCKMNWITTLTNEQLRILLSDEIHPNNHGNIKFDFDGSLKIITNQIKEIYENSSVDTG